MYDHDRIQSHFVQPLTLSPWYERDISETKFTSVSTNLCDGDCVCDKSVWQSLVFIGIMLSCTSYTKVENLSEWS